MLPDYINYKSKTNIHCDFYMHEDCENTCNFSKQILGVGATDQGTAKRIKNNLDKLLKEDLGDY